MLLKNHGKLILIPKSQNFDFLCQILEFLKWFLTFQKFKIFKEILKTPKKNDQKSKFHSFGVFKFYLYFTIKLSYNFDFWKVKILTFHHFFLTFWKYFGLFKFPQKIWKLQRNLKTPITWYKKSKFWLFKNQNYMIIWW